MERSATLVLLATEKVLTRPWCLLELWHAHRKRVPVIIMRVEGKGFEMDKARELIDDLETRLPASDRDFIMSHLTDTGPADGFATFKQTLRDALRLEEQHGMAPRMDLVWKPSATDNQIVALAVDLLDHMASVVGCTLEWNDAPARLEDPQLEERRCNMWGCLRQPMARVVSLLGLHIDAPQILPKVLVIADIDTAVEARLLQA